MLCSGFSSLSCAVASYSFIFVVKWTIYDWISWLSWCSQWLHIWTGPPRGDKVNWCFWAKFLLPAAANHQTDDNNKTETKASISPQLCASVSFMYIFFATWPAFCVYYSNKDEEAMKNYKNVYSKLLRTEKDTPLLSRVELYIELLQQLTPQTGSDVTGTSKT